MPSFNLVSVRNGCDECRDARASREALREALTTLWNIVLEIRRYRGEFDMMQREELDWSRGAIIGGTYALDALLDLLKTIREEGDTDLSHDRAY